MRRRLLVLGLAAAAAVSFAPSASAAIEYTRQCGGSKTVDRMCYHDYCGIASCTRYDCHVWYGPYGDPNTAVCIGQPRPPM